MQQVIEKLARVAEVDLSEPGAHFTIYNEPYMRLAVERLDANRVSVAHYYEQNGDLCQDPDVEFYTNVTGWYPYAMQDTWGYRRYVEFDDGGHSARYYNRNGQADLTKFCTFWANNISRQGFYEATDIRK
jgi:hypothetical protein